MKFSNVPTYTVGEIEHKSRDLLAKEFGQGMTIPIDAELILERMEGVFFDVWPGLSANHCIMGMTCRDTSTGDICVFIDEGISDDYRYHARSRMTVAEELGHVVLHREIINLVESPEDFIELQGHSKWREMDRNAKRFAAAILMPGDAVLSEARKLYPQLVHVAGYGNTEAVINTMTSRLAKMFEVSPQAMGIRLKEWPARVIERVTAAISDALDYF